MKLERLGDKRAGHTTADHNHSFSLSTQIHSLFGFTSLNVVALYIRMQRKALEMVGLFTWPLCLKTESFYFYFVLVRSYACGVNNTIRLQCKACLGLIWLDIHIPKVKNKSLLYFFYAALKRLRKSNLLRAFVKLLNA